MSLKTYKEKRNFNKTPEPAGIKNATEGKHRGFVIQKHHASRLHYDLRLEADGVLISWAVPKGPSQNTADKRLAMRVEDHPLDYYNFEGIIPKGNYGAGTVMIWDWGNYTLKEEINPKKISKIVRDGLEKGKLHLIFNGTKIKGEFALVKTNKGKEEWLFFKIKDEYASDKPYKKNDISVKSGRSFSEIKNTAEGNDEIWLSPPDFSNIDFEGAKKTRMPSIMKPMLASTIEMPFDNKNWIFEIKWDGYRCLSKVLNGAVEMYSRNLKSFNNKFKTVYNSLKIIPYNAIFDGEIVIVDAKGRSDFSLLQNYKASGTENLVYYIFDLIYLDEYDLTSLPLIKRKEILEDVLPSLQNIRYSDHIPETGNAFFKMALSMDLEGIIGKKKDGKYLTGSRTNDWVKIKTQKRLEAVICGYTKPRGGRKYFGALILGIYEDKQLKYIGHAGGGFSNSDLKSLHKQLSELETANSPFKIPPATNMPVTWVKPKLICEIKYLDWTKDKILRNPVFLGLREDKNVKDLKIESQTEVSITDINGTHIKKKGSKVSEFNDLDELLSSGKKEGILIVGDKKLKLTNLNKIYWPELKYSKGDLLKYYWDVSDYILYHLKDRPESLHRHPNGIYGKSFYQKDMRDLPPDWIETKEIKSDSANRTLKYLLCQNKATLIYLANLGCIELNPWSSRINKLEYPDFTIIDLDPPDTISFDKVTEVALATKSVLDEAGVEAFIKTSGASGMHILIPLKRRYNYEQSRQFALLIGNLVHYKTKNITSLDRLIKKRSNKIYIDCLQNYAGQTIASAYCARPIPGATVSAPLEWDEIDRKLSPSDFNIKNMMKRLEDKGDLLKGLYSTGNDISLALNKFENVI
jgi:bifunctional non-homologous end joining protein LigD